MKSILVENDQDNIYINIELLFFNLQQYVTLPHMLFTITGKSPLKKNKKKRMPHLLFRKILMRNWEFFFLALPGSYLEKSWTLTLTKVEESYFYNLCQNLSSRVYLFHIQYHCVRYDRLYVFDKERI